MDNKAKEVVGDTVHYVFVCEGCQSEGELEIPAESNFDLNCPEGCGARYIQWMNPMSASWELMCVVCPVFAE